MCGIFGMIGDKAVSNTLKALQLLEYRGYDSAGVATRRDGFIEIRKTEGRISALNSLMQGVTETHVAIGHTRWATHGSVCTANAHPFLSPSGRFAVVHNGIIENYLSLKSELGADSRFTSQTDSEIVAHLLDKYFDGDVLRTLRIVAQKLQGSFAIAVLTTENDKLYAVKNKSPLIVGTSDKGVFLCSDVRCLSHWADSVAVTPDNTAVELSKNGVKFYDFYGKPVTVNFFAPEKPEQMQQADGDFMLKEIWEIPKRLRLAKEGYFRDGGLKLETDTARKLNRIYLIGCGTAYNSGLQTAAVARRWLDVDIIPVIASEFIYDKYPVDGNTLAFFISQSGETADTVRAAERVKSAGGITYAVTNTTSSSLTFACEKTACIYAGGEYAVASTKAYNCQLLTLTLLLADIGRLRGTFSQEDFRKLTRSLDEVPDAVQHVLNDSPNIARLAESLASCSAVFYIGRTCDYPTACEGSLKLKEISYIHSEAYPAGELKHGTLALMEPSVAVVAISTDAVLKEKTASSVTEVTTRGARAVSVAPYVFKDAVPLTVPDVGTDVAGMVSVVPLQLIAYYAAKRLGRDVDKPRHLAKSVTVE